MALIGIGALVSIGVIYLYSASKFTPTAGQKACVVTAEDVASQFAITVNPSAESWDAKRYLDGAVEISYDYDDTSGSGLYMSSMLSVSATESDAQFGFTGQWQGFKLGTNIAGAAVELEEANHVFQWGDSSHFAFLRSGGARLAYAFVGRKDSKVFFLTVSNALLEEPAEVDAFLRPFLERFEAESF
jgi:hypothetical protein